MFEKRADGSKKIVGVDGEEVREIALFFFFNFLGTKKKGCSLSPH